MEKIITLEAEVISDETLILEAAPEIKIDASKSITAEIAPDTYVLGSIGSFNTASSWVGTYVNELVQESIGTGGTLADALDLIRTDVMDEIETGVNQVITQIENEYVSNSALTTTLASEIGASRSSILDIVQTYADETSATATAINGLKASLGGDSSSSAIEAFIGSIAIVHVDANSATAATVDVLTTVYNDLSVELTDTREIAIGEFTEWDGNGTPTLGMFKYEGGVWYQYRGGTLGTYADGWVITPVSAALAASSAVNNELETFASATNSSITNLQNQVDGSISTWFGTTAPSITAYPVTEWEETDTDDNIYNDYTSHIGDLYYDKSSGYAYRFAHEDIPEDDPNHNLVYVWIRITDTDITAALANAAKAQDTADGKRIVFYDDAVPSSITGVNGYTVEISDGDLWIPSSTALEPTYVKGEVYAYVSGATPREWVLATRYTDAITAVSQEFTTWQNDEYDEFVTAITTQTDRKSESYYQDTPDPSTTWERTDDVNHVGDLWKTPGDGNKEYVWMLDGTYKWVEMEVPDIVFDTIDKKKAIYTGTANPWDDINNDVKDNDMWITANGTPGYADKQVYVWSDSQSEWVKPLTYATDAELTLLETGLGNGTVAIDLSSATINGTQSLTDYVAEEIDKEVVVYSGTDHTAQTGMKVNDIYIEKTVDNSGAVPVDVVNTWKYSGTVWNQIGNNNNLTALADLADGKRTIYRGTTTPQAQGYTPELRDVWIPETGVSGYDAKEMYVYDGVTGADGWDKATKYTDDIAANRNKQVFREDYSANGPTGAEEGDLWFVTNYYYTGATGTGSSTTLTEYGILTKEYINSAWVNVAVEDRSNYAGISWAGYASSLLTGPNGEITGWQYSDGGTIGGESTSEFKISADKFILANGTTDHQPFTVDTVSGLTEFNGVVNFTNSDMSSYDNSKSAIFYDDFEYESSTQLKDNWEFISGANNSAYLSEVKASGAYSMGVGTYNGSISGSTWREHNDFFVFDPAKLYKLSCKARESTTVDTDGTCYIGLVCYSTDKITKLNTSGTNSYSSSHYITASSVHLTGTFQEFIGYFKGIATTGVGGVHTDMNTPAKLYSGTAFVRPLIIANYNGTQGAMYFDELKIEEVVDPVELINSNTTSIDGGKITTGTVLSNAFYGNVIYNLVAGVPATEGTYTMKIDLANGYVHIR